MTNRYFSRPAPNSTHSFSVWDRETGDCIEAMVTYDRAIYVAAELNAGRDPFNVTPEERIAALEAEVEQLRTERDAAAERERALRAGVNEAIVAIHTNTRPLDAALILRRALREGLCYETRLIS